MPDKIQVWYEFPEAYVPHITSRTDGFVVALFFLAIALHEDIEVTGTLSPRLLHSLDEYQRIFAIWFPVIQDRWIDITCERLEAPSPEHADGATACFFSGGVDSFFTLWSHLPANELIPAYQLTHGLFLHGFDIELEHEQAFRTAFSAYRRVFDTLDLTLIPVRTNLKRFINKQTCGWTLGHGPFLISVPLVLGNLISRCYVPASGTYGLKSNLPKGSHPLVDHLLSTETLQVIHDGAWTTRVKKTITLAQWPPTYDHLYVCFGRAGDGLKNCCRCEKCIRTMIALELADALDRYTTFPLPLRGKDILRWRLSYKGQRALALELAEYAESSQRKDLARKIRYAILRHDVRESRLGQIGRKLFVEPAKRSHLLTRLYRSLVQS